MGSPDRRADATDNDTFAHQIPGLHRRPGKPRDYHNENRERDSHASDSADSSDCPPRHSSWVT
jgi:hypothetical protein